MSDPTQTERKRRYRSRLNGNMLFAVADVPADLVIRLIELGYLSDGASMDARQRGEALVRFAVSRAHVSAST